MLGARNSTCSAVTVARTLSGEHLVGWTRAHCVNLTARETALSAGAQKHRQGCHVVLTQSRLQAPLGQHVLAILQTSGGPEVDGQSSSAVGCVG
jgi:hypothetical protein